MGHTGRRILPCCTIVACCILSGLALASLAACTAPKVPMSPPPDTSPPAAESAIAGVRDLTFVAQLTGAGAINPTDTEYGVYGADLGHLFDWQDQLYMVFGDTFGCCIPGTGGPGGARDWRSNTMAVLTDRDPSDGLRFDSMIADRPGHAQQLLRPGRDDKTVIPTNGVSIGDRLFLHYMAVASWGAPGEWELNRSGLAYSDDGGQTWTKAPEVTWEGKSNFGQVAFVKSDDLLYLFGIPGGRFGGVKLARVGQDSVLDKAAYRYFVGSVAGEPLWSPDENAAVSIVPPPVGELSVMWNPYLGRWIMTYLDEQQAALVIRDAPELWGPWSESKVLVSGRDYPSLYGAYMHPWLVENDGEVIYFTMSQWGPYNVFLMRARLERAD